MASIQGLTIELKVATLLTDASSKPIKSLGLAVTVPPGMQLDSKMQAEVSEMLKAVRWMRSMPGLGSYWFDTTAIVQHFPCTTSGDDASRVKLCISKLQTSARQLASSMAKKEFETKHTADISEYCPDNMSQELCDTVISCVEKRGSEFTIPVRCCQLDDCPEFHYRLLVLKHMCNCVGIPVPTYKGIKEVTVI